MAKVPLTPAGIDQKQNELYALNRTQLDIEASKISADFRAWVNDNIQLTEVEQAYWKDAGSDFVRFISGLVSVSVRNRIRTDFIIENPQRIGVKRLLAELRIDSTYTWQGSLNVNGKLSLKISYE